MRTLAFLAAVLASMLLMSCHNEPSLQKYFVENSEKKGFVTLDISSDILNVDKNKLSPEQKEALASFNKMNILVFKQDSTNAAQYAIESQKVAKLLKSKEYQQLMRIGSGKEAASVSCVGNDDHINEFVLFAKRKANGFAVVRILGNDMNPNNIATMLSLLKGVNIDMEQLQPLQGLIK